MTSPGSDRSIIDELLSRIEQRELPSLQWGYVDGSLTWDEIVAIAEGVAADHAVGWSADGIIGVLRDSRLIFKVRSAGADLQFRSRFAETVRLLARLRQVTPTAPWSVAPQLVSGFRVSADRRRVPTRTVSPTDTAERLMVMAGLDQPREQLLRALLQKGGEQTLLADFQLKVAAEVLAWRESPTRGMVVTAGTGSGKTLAFYMPAIVRTGLITRPSEFWTKVVSVYPRTELLKDQFSEVAALARATDDVQRAARRRPIRLGALFGDTPREASREAIGQRWVGSAGGSLCPYLRCPECSRDLVWLQDDIDRGLERLTCVNSNCHTIMGADGQIGLTRASLKAQPPDFLFTTAETLNMRMSDPDERAVLGIPRQRERRARLLLLDEVHTYSGASGAQVGNVIRRWRGAIDRPVLVTGLSATLQDASRYFAELTGLHTPWVTEVRPTEDDLQGRSMAYQVVMKADASNRTAVLSTTIQAAMLLGRMGDPRGTDAAKSKGFFGSRLFVFTDKLDITNRLYDDLRDAEGIDSWGRSVKPPLAGLRASSAGDDRIRAREGQLWDVSEQIRGSIDTPLRVSRTSSQDVGVDAASDVIVATSSLEVGFNDPFVGSVIQHRAPRDLAAFVQRRGRAGRAIEMRPWMLTVLSEYGRDRLQYQSYEQLLEPVLPPRRLPTSNLYVLRMQAAYALLDWLSQLPDARVGGAWAWLSLSGPTIYPRQREHQRAVARVLDRLLDGDEPLTRQLHDHVSRALGLSHDETDAVMWAPPRSLLLEVVPTLSRRLATEWRIRSEPGRLDFHASGPYPHPLPDFMPRALFSDLNLPEVLIQLPPATRGGAPSEHVLPVSQALRELAPGHVTRRFGVERARLSHWVEVESAAPTTIMRLGQWITSSSPLGEVTLEDGRVVQAHRPWTITPQIVPKDVSPTSRGDLRWQSTFEGAGIGDTVSLPRGAALARSIPELSFHLTARRSAVTVTRFSGVGEATVRRAGGTETVVRVDLVDDDGVPAAVGFRHEVDGIRAPVLCPSDAELADLARSEHGRAWLPRYLHDRIAHDETLSLVANRFQLSWIADSILLALLLETVSASPARDEIFAAVRSDLWGSLNAAAELLVGSGVESDPEESDDGSGSGIPREASKLLAGLRELIDSPDVLRRLDSHLAAIQKPPDDFIAWLREMYVETVADSLLAACQIFVPQQTDTDALLVDVADPTGESPILWITETILGGGGVIEAIARAYVRDPWRFLRAVDAALAPGDSELVADSLDRSVRLMADDDEVASVAARLRATTQHRDRLAAQLVFNQELGKHGVPVDQSLAVALNQRILRRGTDRRMDGLLAELASYRKTVEASVQLAVDHRLMSLALAAGSRYATRLAEAVGELRGDRPTTSEVASVLAGVLWPTPAELRGYSGQAFNPYRPASRVDPEVVRTLVRGRVRSVHVTDRDWAKGLREILAQDGIAGLVVPRSRLSELARILTRFVAQPIELDFLRVYPTVAALEVGGDSCLLKLEVRELA